MSLDVDDVVTQAMVVAVVVGGGDVQMERGEVAVGLVVVVVVHTVAGDVAYAAVAEG